MEEAALRLVEVWPAGEDDRDSHEKANESGEPEFMCLKRGYEEMSGFPLELGEDATDERYREGRRRPTFPCS